MENNPIALSKESFRQLGHQFVDAIADFNSSMQSKPVTFGRLPSEVQVELGQKALPQKGTDPSVILSEATALLFNHSLFNGHPRFLGYITSSPTPIGALTCFFLMKETLEGHRHKYLSKYDVAPSFKAGLHYGNVTTEEIGTLKKDIVFTGDTLNTTACIQNLCNFYETDLLV
ncbi:hypothetical protein [Robiginitalea sediminis]|uniref:hypothetical protein n=1 Tax=Robiginitalea sediminis TaxID=1982593 RepID=UPI000B4A72F1|nr:hypothetical protein [Robiginitalea sediminis]